MRKILLAFALLPLSVIAQSTYTVCNTPGMKADYNNLQAAVNAVPAGSTIMVFPGGGSYGDVVVSKKLSIYGTGFLLGENSEPYTAPDIRGVVLNTLRCNPGSDNSVLEGLQFTDMNGIGGLNRMVLDSVRNVTVSRCDFYMRGFGPDLLTTRNTFNCIFRNCYVVPRQPDAGFDASGGPVYREFGTGSINLQFLNNIFDNRGGGLLGFSMNYNVTPANYGEVFFTNNTFSCYLAFSNFCGYTYRNNIFYNTVTATITPEGVGMTGAGYNNITNAPVLFKPNSGNRMNVSMDTVLVYNSFGYHSFDEKYRVLPNSFAKTFSTSGGEIGAYGGDKPYVLSGIPALPEIYAYSITRDSTIRGNIKLRIKAKSIY